MASLAEADGGTADTCKRPGPEYGRSKNWLIEGIRWCSAISIWLQQLGSSSQTIADNRTHNQARANYHSVQLNLTQDYNYTGSVAQVSSGLGICPWDKRTW